MATANFPPCIPPTMAESECQKRTNWYQCVRLLLEGGRAILKEILKQSYEPGTFDDFLNSKLYKDILDDLFNKKHILNETQWNQLFPHADIDNLDISLLSCIILNCVIQPNSTQRTAVEDIRNLRNSMFGHTSTELMTKDEFEKNWKEINTTFSKAQQEFGINISLNEVIVKIEREQVDNVELLRELKAWKKFDDGLKEEIMYVRTRVSNLEEKVEKVEDIQKSISLMNERKWTIDDQAWSELQNFLLNRYKILINSPVTAAPLSTQVTEIDDIYEKPKLKLIDYKALRTQSSGENEKSLNLKDILISDGKKYYNIYVTGDAGIGKTSLSKFIVSSWCKTHQDKSNNDFNELGLKQFDFLFYISLRHATDQFDIKEMIESQHLNKFVESSKVLSGVTSTFLLQELFRHFAEKCLIILDGLDEWTAKERSADPSISNGVPMRNSSLKYTIMTFTRPWKLEELRLKDYELDRQIKITGIEDISAFGEKLISVLNKKGIDKKDNKNMSYTDFDKRIHEAGLLKMQETPFILKHLICLWFDNKEFGKSMTDVYTRILEHWFEIAEEREEKKSLFKPPDNTTIATPQVLKKNGKCDSYKTLLMAVGKLAFETLMHREGMHLVFDSLEAHDVTEDQMCICLKVGILTKYIVPDMISAKKDFSFSHKTFQEYFAALYMGWYSGNHENIESRMPDITLHDREQFFIFLSAMWPSVFERQIEIQLDKMDDQYNVIGYNHSLLYLQDFVITCCTECINQNNICPKVNLRRILLTHGLRPKDVHYIAKNCDILSRMHQQLLTPNGDFRIVDLSNLTKLKCIDILFINGMELQLSPAAERLNLYETNLLNHNGIESLMESVSRTKGLRYIKIDSLYCREHGKNQCFLNVDLSMLNDQICTELRYISANKIILSPATEELRLNRIGMFNHNGIVSLMEMVSSMKGQRTIQIENIYCRDHDINTCFLNVDFSKLNKLKYVKLSSIFAKEMCLIQTIEKLCLQNITFLNHNGIVSLIASVSGMKCPRSLTISKIYCREDKTDCFLNVNLSKLDELRSVKLSHMSAMEICLSQATEKLKLEDIKLLNHNGMKCVSGMKGLKSIQMATIYCREHGKTDCFLNVDLSKLDELRSVELSHISAMEICLSPATEKLNLDDIKLLNYNGIKGVSSMKGLKSIKMKSVYCREHDYTEYFLNVDLSKLDELRSVELSHIFVMEIYLSPATEKLNLYDIRLLNHNGLKGVASMKGLKSIQMNTIYCRDNDKNECFLNVDLSKLDKLRSVNLSDISVKEMRLSPTITELKLNDIKWLSHNRIVSLMEDVSSIKFLKSIEIKTVYCTDQDKNECFLNLDVSKLDELSSVDLSDISAKKMCMSPTITELILNDIILLNHNEIESLMESVSSMKCLTFIVMRTVYCREHNKNECFLKVDLSKLDERNSVKLSHISVREMRLSPATENLDLDDIKLLNHNVWEGLSSMKGLKLITMNTIYCREDDTNECFLNVDLSKLDKLREVNLSHISVMELCLSSATDKLSLEDIKLLSHNGLEGLSSMKGLEWITMKAIYCREHGKNNCFLNVDLSKLDELRWVELCHTCISTMEICMSPTITTLNLHDIKVFNHNGIVSLMEGVSSMKYLIDIDMKTVYCKDHDKNECFMKVDLSKLGKLSFVYLSDISAMEMCMSPNITLLYLNDIKLFNHNGIDSLMEVVSSMKYLDNIKMKTVYCRDHDKNECFSNKSLKRFAVDNFQYPPSKRFRANDQEALSQ